MCVIWFLDACEWAAFEGTVKVLEKRFTSAVHLPFLRCDALAQASPTRRSWATSSQPLSK